MYGFYLSKSNDMELFEGRGHEYMLVYVRIPTKYGTVTITAVKYGS